MTAQRDTNKLSPRGGWWNRESICTGNKRLKTQQSHAAGCAQTLLLEQVQHISQMLHSLKKEEFSYFILYIPLAFSNAKCLPVLRSERNSARGK